MKTLLLIRHAKSDWNDPSLKDFDRPLNDRGKRDAPIMAQRLLDKKVAVDQFITSTAKRARKTAETFAKAYKAKDAVVYFDELYLAGPAEFADVIRKTDKKQNAIAVFSHNPGITEYANMLADVRIDNIPTCGIFAVKADVKTWDEFESATKEFWFFDYPKAGND